MTDPKFQVEAAKYGPRTVAPPPPQRGTREHGTERTKSLYADALCRGEGNVYGTVFLYPELHPDAAIAAAKKLCSRCPVFDECKRTDEGVGIRAGVAHMPKRRPLVERTCHWCRQPFFGKSPRWCSETCKMAYRYEERKTFRSVSADPVLALFPGESVHHIARAVGVISRTVFRWKAGGTIAQFTAEKIANRVGKHPYELWPELRYPSCVRVEEPSSVRGLAPALREQPGARPEAIRRLPMSNTLRVVSTPDQSGEG